jgi:hypothetical protein
VPWPDHSELTFGFSFLREFERQYTPCGAFPKAPDFISQYNEATKGYDVEAALDDSTPIFFQFKRSFVIKSPLAKEIQCGDFAAPVLYRMHLRRKNKYQQHLALQSLEEEGNAVVYVTSQIESHDDLTKAYTAGTVVHRSAALFAPREITLPDHDGDHWLSFRASDNWAYIYSEEGHRFRRKFPQWGRVVESELLPRRRGAVDNRKMLEAVVVRLSQASPEAARLAARCDHPAAKASVLAFLMLDAQLTFFQSEAKADVQNGPF